MFRTSAVLSLAAVAVAAATPAAAESSTIRIEPRPYYGAIVTIEQGVRVWRPLPPTKYVIINPEGRTPLNLNLTDIQERSTSHNHFYGADSRLPAAGGGNSYAVPFGASHRGRGGDRRHGSRVHRGGKGKPGGL